MYKLGACLRPKIHLTNLILKRKLNPTGANMASQANRHPQNLARWAHGRVCVCVCVCVHACMHACMHAYIHACVLRYATDTQTTYTCMLRTDYIHACMHACMHTFILRTFYIHRWTQGRDMDLPLQQAIRQRRGSREDGAGVYMCMYVCIRVYMCIYVFPCTCMYIYIYMFRPN